MSSVRARPALIALLAILAIAVAAATLNSAVATEGGIGAGTDGQGGGLGENTGPGDQGGGGFIPLGPPPEGFSLFELPCYPILNDPRVLLGIAIALLGISYALYRRAGLLAPIGLLAAIGPPGMFIHLLLTACTRGGGNALFPGGGGGNNTTGLIGSAASGLVSGGAESGGTPVVSLFLLGVLGIALVAAVVLLFQSTDDDVIEGAPEEEPEVDPARMAAIGRVAGRAADRIEEDADADNAVYRAWREMTTHLDVERPESSTPAEFAAAAVEAGMNTEDVSELTALFEEVRYGGAEPTAEREERALSALRRIEEEYAGTEE